VDDSLEKFEFFLSCIVVLMLIPVAWGAVARIFRLPAEILVVEGWIGRDGIRAAEAEVEQGGYQYVVATGWPDHRQGLGGRWLELRRGCRA
jgi:hypothetical protein